VLLDSYRAPALKAHLVSEAHGKCVYCESKITHVYFGDIEHIKPKAKFPRERLDVENLVLACAICNNAKGDYRDASNALLNPYVEDPDQEILALGYLIARRPGQSRARLTIKQLDLNRQALLERRRERVERLQPLAEQYMLEPSRPCACAGQRQSPVRPARPEFEQRRDSPNSSARVQPAPGTCRYRDACCAWTRHRPQPQMSLHF
jgi:uncharacterized protein (TIGR02646 family)